MDDEGAPQVAVRQLVCCCAITHRRNHHPLLVPEAVQDLGLLFNCNEGDPTQAKALKLSNCVYYLHQEGKIKRRLHGGIKLGMWDLKQPQASCCRRPVTTCQKLQRTTC